MTGKYISEYLTHWTKDINTVHSILSKYQLWLEYNSHIHKPLSIRANLRMTCFTDIPLSFSYNHCSRYGEFGIVFHKSTLKKYGANPVFYFTESITEDTINIYDVICKMCNESGAPNSKPLIDSAIRLFNFMKAYSDNNSDDRMPNYYEREWRILELNLQRSDEIPIPPGKYGIIEGKYCFQFEESDVADIIVPQKFAHDAEKLCNGKSYSYKIHENLVKATTRDFSASALPDGD